MIFFSSGAGGIEPTTFGFGDRCSTILNYTPKIEYSTYKRQKNKNILLKYYTLEKKKFNFSLPLGNDKKTKPVFSYIQLIEII